ncbi:cytochrome P450 [Streptodolium elevatio]
MNHSALPRLHGAAFSESPEDAYASLRAAGPVAWAEIAPGVRALVVTDHAAARELLTGADFARSPEHWTPLPDVVATTHLALLRPGGLQHVDGPEHERLRGVLDDCLAGVDLHAVRRGVQRHGRALVGGFAPRGHADLMAEYADQVAGHAVADVLGCPDDHDRIRAYARSVVDAGPDSVEAAGKLMRRLREIVRAKQGSPGADLTSRLLAHPARLGPGEVELLLSSMVLLGIAPTAAWIGTALHALLTEPAYAGEFVGGAVTIRGAMDAALAARCPVANASVHYARRPAILHGVVVAPGVPVLVGHAAVGTDPARPGRGRPRDRSHLAWSAGPHHCPAQALAATVAEAAIETVVDALWDLSTPTRVITGRPGPFQQCPVHLGVVFAPDRRDGVTGAAGGGADGVVDTSAVTHATGANAGSAYAGGADTRTDEKGVTTGHAVSA